ncbi:MAG: DUF6691 family protein [Polyangiaceae bacterium]
MIRLAVAYVCGLLFAVGLGISGMTHPSKVLAFLDFAGDWDPSLAFVMGAGVLVNLVAFRLAARMRRPLLAPAFAAPAATALDAALVTGSVVFGVGWGLGGFCPGPAVVSVAVGASSVVAFVVAMLASMALYDARGRLERTVAAREV